MLSKLFFFKLTSRRKHWSWYIILSKKKKSAQNNFLLSVMLKVPVPDRKPKLRNDGLAPLFNHFGKHLRTVDIVKKKPTETCVLDNKIFVNNSNFFYLVLFLGFSRVEYCIVSSFIVYQLKYISQPGKKSWMVAGYFDCWIVF